MLVYSRREFCYSYLKTPSKHLITQQLQKSATEFSKLIEMLSVQDLKKKKPGKEWTIEEILVHIVAVLETLPSEIDHAKSGQPRRNFSVALLDFLSFYANKLNTFRYSDNQLLQKYSAAVEKILLSFQTIKKNDWQKGANLFGTYQTVASLAQKPLAHFRHHKKQILDILNTNF